MLKYNAHMAGDILIFNVEPADPADVQASQREWIYRTVEAQDHPWLAIDLHQIHHVTSSDIGFLIMLKRRLDTRDGKMVLFGIDPFILDVLRTMKIDPLFMIAANRDEALRILNAPT